MISKPILDWMRSQSRAQDERNRWDKIHEFARRRVDELRRSLTADLNAIPHPAITELPPAWKDKAFAEVMMPTGRTLLFKVVQRAICYDAEFGNKCMIISRAWEMVV